MTFFSSTLTLTFQIRPLSHQCCATALSSFGASTSHLRSDFPAVGVELGGDTRWPSIASAMIAMIAAMPHKTRTELFMGVTSCKNGASGSGKSHASAELGEGPA